MTLSDLFPALRPQTNRFFRTLERHAQVAHEAAWLLERFARFEISASAALDAIEPLEQRNEELLVEMEEALQTTIVTPIDRDDLQRLSAALGGVVRPAREALATAVTFAAEPTEATLRLSAALARATTSILAAVGGLGKADSIAMLGAARDLKVLTKTAAMTYQEAISELVDLNAEGSKPTVHDARSVIREEMVLGRLAHAISRTKAIGRVFAELSAKHG